MIDLSPFAPDDAPECPECGAPAVRTTHAGRTLAAASRGYDDDGRYHIHDPNVNRAGMECENGHSWTESSGRSPCPAKGCTWGRDDAE